MAYQFNQTGAEIQDILDLAQLQIAAPYDAGASYTAGMYCTKDDGFYVCTASTSGTWDASKWSAVTVGDVLETANANISSLNATLTNINSGFVNRLSVSAINLASGSWVAADTRTFSPGLYLYIGGAAFDTNATGVRAIDISGSSDTTHGRLSPMVSASSNQTRIQVIRLLNFTSSTSYSLWVYQNSGSTIAVYPWFSYIRLA